MIKDIIIFLLIIAAVFSFVFIGVPKMFNVQFIGNHTLHDEHVKLEAMQAQIGFAMAATYADMNNELKKANSKLDLLLNIATNTVDGVRVVK